MSSVVRYRMRDELLCLIHCFSRVLCRCSTFLHVEAAPFVSCIEPPCPHPVTRSRDTLANPFLPVRAFLGLSRHVRAFVAVSGIALPPPFTPGLFDAMFAYAWCFSDSMVISLLWSVGVTFVSSVVPHRPLSFPMSDCFETGLLAFAWGLRRL